MPNNMMAVIPVLAGYMSYHGHRYAFPNQDSILKQLSRFHETPICRRTLNYWLKDLVQRNYFKRIRRHKRGSDGRLFCRSTLYKAKGKFFRYMYSLANHSTAFVRICRIEKRTRYRHPNFSPAKAVHIGAALQGAFGPESYFRPTILGLPEATDPQIPQGFSRVQEITQYNRQEGTDHTAVPFSEVSGGPVQPSKGGSAPSFRDNSPPSIWGDRKHIDELLKKQGR